MPYVMPGDNQKQTIAGEYVDYNFPVPTSSLGGSFVSLPEAVSSGDKLSGQYVDYNFPVPTSSQKFKRMPAVGLDQLSGQFVKQTYAVPPFRTPGMGALQEDFISFVDKYKWAIGGVLALTLLVGKRRGRARR